MNPEDDNGARTRALERIRSSYRTFENGRSDRWQGTDPGSRLVQAERDAWLLTELRAYSPERVVDIGSGDGFVARMLDEHVRRPDYFGIDLLPERVALARRLTPWGRFEEGSADQLPLPDGWANAVVALTVFSSIPDPQLRLEIAREVDRVTAADGVVLVYDLRYPSPWNGLVQPIRRAELARLFPGWQIESHSITLLPPLARTPLAAGARRYGAWRSIGVLRSHRASVIKRP